MSQTVKPKINSASKRHIKCLNDNKKWSSCHWSKSKDLRVLAERNQAVMPVGAWVECGDEYQEHPAIRAMLTEELNNEISREKEESLRRFQDEVRRRVSQRARMRKRQQLQKSSETAEWESRVMQQSTDAAQRLTPRKSLVSSYLQRELAICSPSPCGVHTQEEDTRGNDSPSQYTQQLSKVMKQVRHRLASCQIVRDEAEVSELPGGVWKDSTTRDKPGSHVSGVREDEEEEDEGDDEERENVIKDEEEISLKGQHDHPIHLQSVGLSKDHSSKTVTFQSKPISERPYREPYLTEPGFSSRTESRASQDLWPPEDPQELKKQKQSQFLMYRRLFMEIEREQVKENQRQKKHLRRIARIKAEKERQRMEEERRMERLRYEEEDKKQMAEREGLILERLRLEEKERAEEVERRERAKKIKETARYTEALRAQMMERIAQEKVELPALCSCGDSFWDTHPDTCANNCVFYHNPKAYAQALRSVLLSCDLKERKVSHRASAWKTVSMHALTPRK